MMLRFLTCCACVLCASVDVLVAFYISSRMFMYYHSLANLNALSGAAKMNPHNAHVSHPMA